MKMLRFILILFFIPVIGYTQDVSNHFFVGTSFVHDGHIGYSPRVQHAQLEIGRTYFKGFESSIIGSYYYSLYHSEIPPDYTLEFATVGIKTKYTPLIKSKWSPVINLAVNTGFKSSSTGDSHNEILLPSDTFEGIGRFYRVPLICAIGTGISYKLKKFSFQLTMGYKRFYIAYLKQHLGTVEYAVSNFEIGVGFNYYFKFAKTE